MQHLEGSGRPVLYIGRTVLKVKVITCFGFYHQAIIKSQINRPDNGLVVEAETCHFVTLNKINIHNTSCVLTCESLLLICIHRTQSG
jgi:hypothetical protein